MKTQAADVAVRSLTDLLLEASHAPPNDRIEFRDALAKEGVPAIDAMVDWLTDPELCRFALRAIGRAGQFGEREAAVRALIGAREIVPDSIQAEIEHELTRLDYSAPKLKKPSRPSWAKANPYDVAPLSSASGLSWPGFQRHDFDGHVAGTSWRRRDDPISLPPLITRRLQTIHPHFSSWDVSRSPAVHFAITDRYRQFDDPESGWRAAKLIVYANGPTDELQNTPRQVVAGLYVEKGDGVENGPVDARWDWPRFVASLTEPDINTRLTTAMERHGMQLGDFFAQRFHLPSKPGIGGTGSIENGVVVFRSAEGDELFRGWTEMRHHLERLPDDEWHNLHIWRSWAADEAIAAGPAFAGDKLAPVLLDLGATYLEIIKDAIAAGIHALHRIVERREGSDGQPEVVCLIQARSQSGHFTIPQSVMDEVGLSTDARVRLVVETLEGARRFAGDIDTHSGNEVSFRANDPETSGLENIGPKEWIRVTVSAGGPKSSS